MAQSEPDSAEPRLRAAYSTIREDDIARAVEATYPIGPVAACHLVRRGFNDVYSLALRDGGRCIARLTDRRARGPHNVVFETAFLDHLKRRDVTVGAPLRTRQGALWREFEAPEGRRVLTVTEWLPGGPPRGSLSDIAVMGAALADIHNAGDSYDGPDSLYRTNLTRLRQDLFPHLLAAPTTDAHLAGRLTAAMDRLDARLGAIELNQVICHGDCHGGNAFMSHGADGTRRAGFFDFDDAGPGAQAFDLAVYLWALARYFEASTLRDEQAEPWRSFIAGYRRRRDIATADFEAIGGFVAFRQMWFLGEYATRIPEWGTEAVRTTWLQAQTSLLEAWIDLETPAA